MSSDQLEQFVLLVDGELHSSYRLFADAAKAGLEMQNSDPEAKVSIRNMEAAAQRTAA